MNADPPPSHPHAKSAVTAAFHPAEATASVRAPLLVTHSYGVLVDTLYRCLLMNEAHDVHGRELVLLHKAHVASYRVAGLLGPSEHFHPLSEKAAAAAAETVQESVERLTVQLEAVSGSLSEPPHGVDTAVFSDSDWSDDSDSDLSETGRSHTSGNARSDLDSSSGSQDSGPLLSGWLRPPSASVSHQEYHEHHSHQRGGHGVANRGYEMLLGRILLLYVEVFSEQSEAFAPFTKRGHSMSEEATLLYDHLTQKTHKASAFHSLARNLRWLAVKAQLTALFAHELAEHRRAATTMSSALQPRRPLVAPPSRSRVHNMLSSFYHGAAHKAAHGTPSAALNAPSAPASVPARPHGHDGQEDHVTGSGTGYFRLLNVALAELHSLYRAASSTVTQVLETRVLMPTVFDSFKRAEDVNAAVMDALRSAPVLQLITAYHAAYERAVLTFPGYVLMSRTMRHRIESDAALLPPTTFPDLIVAVHGISSQLISAFQTVVIEDPPAAFELLTSQDKLQALRSALQHESPSREQEAVSISAWRYDSRVYPKPMTAETFSMLAKVQVGDATVMRELAAERFEEAVERLRALSQHDKAAQLTSLAQQRQQQRETLMTSEHASASRAGQLGLSTASFSVRHTTSDSVHIDLLRNDSDTGLHTANSHPSSSTLEPVSPNPAGVTPAALSSWRKKGDSKTENSSVKVEDILSWVDISPQYVVGLGRDDERAVLRPFAVFDKTFTEPLFDNIKDILVTGLTTRDKIHTHQLHKSATHSSSTLVDFVESVLFSSATSSDAVHVGPDFFADPLIVWKESKMPHDVRRITQPVPFNDIDWLQTFVDSPALTSVIHSLSDVSALVDSESHVRKPLANALFLPQADKLGVPSGFLLPLHRSRTARPVKVVDLKYPNSSYVHSAARATYTNAIKGALSDSPIYGPTQAVNAALERIFDFTDVLYLQKQAQALLLIAEAVDGHPRSPFGHSVFARADLDAAIFYLLRSNIMLSAVFVNLFTSNAKLTANYLDHISAKRATSLEILRRRQLTVLPLPHSYFALTFKRDSHTGALTRLKLFVLGFTKLGRSAKPHCAVDFLRPTRETKKRLALQYILTGANFIYVPFPGVNGLPKIIYKELVVREQHRRQMWEAGLLTHIHHYPGELTALFVEHLNVSQQSAALLEEQAVLILQDRKLSPLDFDVVEREQHREVVETWLEHQDHEYRRVQPRVEPQHTVKPGVLLNVEQMLRLASPHLE